MRNSSKLSSASYKLKRKTRRNHSQPKINSFKTKFRNIDKNTKMQLPESKNKNYISLNSKTGSPVRILRPSSKKPSNIKSALI